MCLGAKSWSRTPPPRTPRDLVSPLLFRPKTPRTPMSWDPKDDVLLKQLKEEQRLGWKEIATHCKHTNRSPLGTMNCLSRQQQLTTSCYTTAVQGRTSHACQFRWRRLASGQLKYYQGHRRPPPVTTTSASFANEMASTATAGSVVSPSPKILMHGLHSSSPPRALHAMPHMSPSSESALPPMQHPSLFHLQQQQQQQQQQHHHHHHHQQQQQQHQQHHHHHNHHHQQQHQHQQQHVSQPNWGQSASLYQPTPLPSPTSYAPRFMFEQPPPAPPHNHHHPLFPHRETGGTWSQQEDALLLNRKLSFDEVNVLLATRSEAEIWHRQVKLRQNEMTHKHQTMPTHCMSEVRRDSFEERIPGIGALGYHSASR